MATITFTNLTVSGNMGFQEISFDAFRKILDFIEAQTHGAIPTGADLNDLTEKGIWPGAKVSSAPGRASENGVLYKEEELAAADAESIEPENITIHVNPDGTIIQEKAKEDDVSAGGVSDVASEDEYEDRFREIPNFQGASKVAQIFLDAHRHPERYSREYRTSAQFKSNNPALEDVPMRSMGQILGWMASGMIPDCMRKFEYSETDRKYMNYYMVPVPVPVKKDTIGSRIHKARKESGFLATELADLLGYSDTLLLKWEKDELVPSSEAMENLKKALGDDLFEGLEVK